MDIRSSLDGLRSILGVNPTAPVGAAAEGQRGRDGKRIRQRQGDVEQRGQRGFADGSR